LALEELESRQLLSADFVPVPAEPAPLPLSPLHQAVVSTLVTQDTAAQYSGSVDLVFVDPRVPDSAGLLADLQASGRHFEIITLDTNRDGIVQVTEALADRMQVDAIHFITHGTDAAVQLGSGWLNARTLAANIDAVASWGHALKEDGDLLFYGCDLAGSARGRALVDWISALTQADVAASTDATGAKSLGGNWTLEYHVGSVHAAIAVSADEQRAWDSLLASTISFQDGVSGYVGTQETELTQPNPNTVQGSNTSVSVDLVNGGGQSQGLIRFDNIFGSGPNQIPLGSTILSGTLTVYVTNDSAAGANITLHRMLVDWNEGTATWNSLGGGLNSGVDYLAAVDSTLPNPNSGNNVFNTFSGLQSTLQAWSNGTASNYGWGILNDNNNGLDFRSAEWSTTAQRPRLNVTFNVPPALANGSAFNYTENQAAAAINTAITVSDIDNATLANASVSITGNFAAGEDLLGFVNDGATMGNITGSYAAGVLSLSSAGASATLAEWQAALRAVTYFNSSDSPSTLARTVSYAVNDGTSGSNIVTSTINVTAVNDAAVLDNSRTPVLNAENEDAGAPAGPVGTLVSSLVDFAVPAGQVDNVTDADAAPALGIAVTAANTTNGSWFFSINGGTNWSALGAVTNSNARLLAADANTRIYFQPGANFNGTIASAITFRAWDRTGAPGNGATADTTINGGTTAFSSTTDTASITVNPVNDAPVADDELGLSTAEDTTLNIAVLTGDTDVDGDTLSVTEINGTAIAVGGSSSPTAA
jgi:hypothetical protein